MEWYMPITILPGVGLLILSTTNLLIALNNEIINIKEKGKYQEITQLKLQQLKRLSIALIGLYLVAFAFLLTGILAAILSKYTTLHFSLLVVGTVIMTITIFLLIIYAIKAMQIRQKYLKL